MALIPESIELIQVEADIVQNETEVQADAVDFFIDFENGRWTNQIITGDDAALQWFKLGMMTEKNAFPVFDQFGVPFEQLIEDQLPRDVTEGEIAKGIEDLAALHERIENAPVSVDFQGRKAFVDVRVNSLTERVVIE